MHETTGPIYEVTVSVDSDLVEAFDAWLTSHVAELLDIAGFVKAETFELENDASGRARRVIHYFLASEEALDNYLAGPAESMRLATSERFADRIESSRRVLRSASLHNGAAAPPPSCLNCGSTLTGQYCGNCGQRSQSRLISIWELIRDAFGDLFELDSRLWQTLLPLVFRPGRLTREYLQGRRARFMPPFRTYLVLSLVFFLVAFFDPRQEFGLLFEPTPDSPASTVKDDGSPTDAREEALDELASVAVGGHATPGDSKEASDSASVDFKISNSEADVNCDVSGIQSSEMPGWLASRLTPERIQVMCERIRADSGRALLDKLRENIPAALFFLMPLMALVLKGLYPLSKRYYVEHLLFVVHYHAFFFLVLTFQILFARSAGRVGIPEGVTDLVVIVASLYIPAYLFRAMQRVYAQGVLSTTIKFAFLGISYVLGFGLMVGFAALFAAFSI